MGHCHPRRQMDDESGARIVAIAIAVAGGTGIGGVIYIPLRLRVGTWTASAVTENRLKPYEYENN